MKKFTQGYGFLFVVAGLIIVLDQITKTMVRSSLALGETWAPIESIGSFVRIVNWYNTGVAFGMLQGKGYLFAILGVIVAGAIIYYYPRVTSSDWLLRLALCLQLGGSVGNLIDRLTQDGKVTDYMWIGSFPVFNVADASITIGVALLVLGVWLQDIRQKKVSSTAENGHTESFSEDNA